MMAIDIPEGYESLGLALGEAVAQASHGKGAERHAEHGEKFSDQLIMSIPKRLGDGGECFCLGQAAKKIFESRRLPPERARAEILGAVNYLAAAWCLLGGRESVFVSAPEDADMPRFETGECVEYRLRDGKWKPAGFLCMDGGFAVVVSGDGKRIRIPACDVRSAESVSAPEDAPAAAPLFAEGTAVEYCAEGVWKPGVYVGVDPEGSHVVESLRGVRLRLDGILVRKA